MSALETAKSAYAALGRNDPSVLFGAMDPAINWNQAEGNPLADRNPYVGPQAVGEGVFARLVAAIDIFTVVPSTFIDGGDHVVVLGRRTCAVSRRPGERSHLPSLPSFPHRMPQVPLCLKREPDLGIPAGQRLEEKRRVGTHGATSPDNRI
jgi:ketosteroid isomerase-like protein